MSVPEPEFTAAVESPLELESGSPAWADEADVIVVGFSSLKGVYRDILQAAPLLNIFTQF